MKTGKQIVLAIFFLAAGVNAWSLSIYDPNDRIYTYLSLWDEKGYYDPLSMLRPYTPQLIRSCLEKVSKMGNDMDRSIAREYLSKLDGENAFLAFQPVDDALLHVGVDFSAEEFLNTSAADTFLRPGGELSLNGRICPMVQFSGMTGLWLWNKPESDFIPYRTGESLFYLYGGGANLTLGNTVYNLPSTWKGGIFIGSDTLSFQAGRMKSSFGPFFDTSAIIGPQAPEAGHFSFTWQGGWLTIDSVLLELTAISAVDTASPLGQDSLYSFGTYSNPAGFFPSKYLILHSFLAQPFPWLALGFIQSAVFGARLDPLYLIPFGILADTQINSGDWDNSLMGLFTRLRLPWNLLADISLYVDDMNSNEALKLNFNSDQDKLALHFGLTWTPEIPMLLRIAAEYLILTPYMYTHNRFLFLNYLNYTHFDRHLGSVLDPNSDQLIVKAQFQPFSTLFTEAWLRLSRHGNGSDRGSGSVAGDGTIWDDGIAPDTTVTSLGSSTFLTQSIIETLFQAGVSAEFGLPIGGFTLWLGGDYVFEIVWNQGLVQNEAFNNYLKLTLRVGLK